MYVKVFSHSMQWLGRFGGTAGFEAEDPGEVGVGLLPAGTGSIAGNPGAPIPPAPCPLFES
jgi:hypothetical protein